MAYNNAETEAIGLCIALEAISDIANHKLVKLTDVQSLPGETEVWFHSPVHQELFLIRLLDFARESGDQALTGVKGSCLEILLAACKTKSFDHARSVTSLESATKALQNWLASKTPLRLWLPTLDHSVDLFVPRLDFLYIAGNQLKHNLSRLTALTKRISQILKDHGHSVPVERIPLMLDEFRFHLQEDYFVYYGTWLTELLNNVRWGLQEYLTPEFDRSYTPIPGDPTKYEYKYPTSITSEVPREWYWRLMDHIRAEPYLKRFEGAHYMKKEVLR